MPTETSWRRFLQARQIPVESRTAVRLRAYVDLIERWSRRMNLTSSTRWEHLRLLLEEGLWAAGLYGDRACSHLDIGSGAGFPAIPLKILLPSVRFELIESRERKSFFLERVVEELDLDGVAVFCRRLDAHLESQQSSSGWDRVSWKAVRVSRRDWSRLLACCTLETELWVFHGETIPVEDPGAFLSQTRLRARHAVPNRRAAYLSILQRSSGKRFT